MKLQHHTVDVENDVEAYFNQLGKLSLLVASTPQFSRISMGMGMSMMHAALRHKTYCLYVDDEGKPTAGLIWAYLNEEAKEFYFRYGLLENFDAWRSGDELWLLNVVAEGGLIKAVFKDTMQTLFKDEKEAFMIRPSPTGRRRVVRLTHKGAHLHEVLPPNKTAAAANAARSEEKDS